MINSARCIPSVQGAPGEPRPWARGAPEEARGAPPWARGAPGEPRPWARGAPEEAPGAQPWARGAPEEAPRPWARGAPGAGKKAKQRGQIAPHQGTAGGGEAGEMIHNEADMGRPLPEPGAPEEQTSRCPGARRPWGALPWEELPSVGERRPAELKGHCHPRTLPP